MVDSVDVRGGSVESSVVDSVASFGRFVDNLVVDSVVDSVASVGRFVDNSVVDSVVDSFVASVDESVEISVDGSGIALVVDSEVDSDVVVTLVDSEVSGKADAVGVGFKFGSKVLVAVLISVVVKAG